MMNPQVQQKWAVQAPPKLEVYGILLTTVVLHTHEHILYKTTGVKVCYILFYAPPAALLQGVTHPTL
jgi:hypothetical protein